MDQHDCRGMPGGRGQHDRVPALYHGHALEHAEGSRKVLPHLMSLWRIQAEVHRGRPQSWRWDYEGLVIGGWVSLYPCHGLAQTLCRVPGLL